MTDKFKPDLERDEVPDLKGVKENRTSLDELLKSLVNEEEGPGQEEGGSDGLGFKAKGLVNEPIPIKKTLVEKPVEKTLVENPVCDEILSSSDEHLSKLDPELKELLDRIKNGGVNYGPTLGGGIRPIVDYCRRINRSPVKHYPWPRLKREYKKRQG